MLKSLRFFGKNFKCDSKKIAISLALVLSLGLSFLNSGLIFALEGAKWVDSSKNSISYQNRTYTKGDSNILPEDLKSKNVYVVKVGSTDSNGNNRYEAIVVNSGSADKIEGELRSFKTGLNNKPTSESSSGSVQQNAENEKLPTDCAVEGGAGWIVCMLSNSIANAMDGLYDILRSFLDVQPLKVNERNALFQVWDYMRNIANVVFAIMFILVVYAQITNIGISNYNIKKMLPKLIVAAILINLSYYICAIAIDLSNILGYRVQDLFVGIRKEIFSGGVGASATLDNLNWATLTSSVLAGGTVAIAGAYQFTVAGGVNVLPFVILLVLLSVAYSTLVAITVLAARQALITIMIFLAPLAFAANILPNTEKWFDKWKDIFVTMLVMYPMMALLFGGSQLAGAVIIANANGNIITLILGMAVQVVPLAITPAIIKLSGSLLGKFAGIINNPNKGPIDSAKNFLREGMAATRDQKIINQNKRAAELGARGIGNGKPSFWSTAGLNQATYNRKRKIDSIAAQRKDYQEGRYLQDEYNNLSKYARSVQSGNPSNRLAQNSMLAQNIAAEEYKNRMSNLSKAGTSEYKANLNNRLLIKDDEGNVTGINQHAVNNLDTTSSTIYHSAMQGRAFSEADRNNNISFTNSTSEILKHRKDLTPISAGARGVEGKNASLASIITENSKLHETEVGESNKLVGKFKPDKAELATLSSGYKMENDGQGGVKAVLDNNGAKIKVDSIEKNGITIYATDTMREVVQKPLAKASSAIEVIENLGQTIRGGKLHSVRTETVAGYSEFKKSENPFINMPMIEEMALKGMDLNSIKAGMAKNINNKLSAEKIVSASTEVVEKILYSAIKQEGFMDGYNLDPKTIVSVIYEIDKINNTSSMSGNVDVGKGVALHNIINYVRRNEPNLFEQAVSQIVRKKQSEHPGKNITIADIDLDFTNIRK